MSHSVASRPEMLESTARVLASWQARVTEPEPELLWQLGKTELLLERDYTARQHLARSLRTGEWPWRLAIAILHVPGACAVVRGRTPASSGAHTHGAGALYRRISARLRSIGRRAKARRT